MPSVSAPQPRESHRAQPVGVVKVPSSQCDRALPGFACGRGSVCEASAKTPVPRRVRSRLDTDVGTAAVASYIHASPSFPSDPNSILRLEFLVALMSY